MAIIINLDVMMAKRKVSLKELSERVGVSIQTLESMCKVLDCQPGDILEYKPNA
jgi:putative transcriptional regulator